MARKIRPLHSIIVIFIILLCAALFLSARRVAAPETSEPAASSKPAPQQPAPKPEPQPSYDTSSAASIQVIVNKQRPLNPIEYAPSNTKSVGNGQQLRTEAADQFLRMQTAAQAAGAPLTATSGYRSYTYQQNVYGGYVKQYGVAQTDTFSARPGYSEHQTGLAIDIQGGGCSLDNCFANTPQGKWLAANDYKYGFILRYPADKTAVTGYQWEAWHFRYVGVELATDMHTKGITTLEEYFTVSGGNY